jgi:hypothetical protein
MNSRRVASSAAIATLVLLPASADAYRPFISTDADTAAYRTIELELGFFGLQRQDGGTHGQTPQAVFNYGFRPGFEAVGQLDLDEPPGGGARVLDAELSVKNVLRQGVLQDKPGPSVAMESLLLLPGAAGEDQPRVGWEESLILSHKLGDFTCHWNASLGLDQTATLPLGEWGLIGEHPLVDGVRAVGELAGEAVNTLTPENSGLLGLIWSSGWRDADFDLGVRRGLSAAAPLWSVVAGISIPFAADGSPDSNPRRPND